MSGFPPITVRQPHLLDLVDDPVRICGVATGFEGIIFARARDANGQQLAEDSIRVGGTGIWGNFAHQLAPGGDPPAAQGILEVFQRGGNGEEINKNVLRIVFGPALIDPYHGFAQHTVALGETLSGIAEQFYGEAGLFNRIFEANRDELLDPDLIFVGQVLRIPQ